MKELTEAQKITCAIGSLISNTLCPDALSALLISTKEVLEDYIFQPHSFNKKTDGLPAPFLSLYSSIEKAQDYLEKEK